MKRIAVFLPNWIGDVVMATPAIRALREHFPGAELAAVCKPYVAETLAGAPWFAETILYDKKGTDDRRFFTAARKLGVFAPEAAVLFPNSLRPAVLAKLAGAKRIVGFARYGRDFLLTQRLYPARNAEGQLRPMPAIDDYNRVVELLGVPSPGHRMELFTTALDEAGADETWNKWNLNNYPEVIGLNSGGAFGSSKHWPTEYFAELARDLADRRGCAVVALCGPGEREVAREIAAKAARPGVIALADEKLSLGFTKAVVKRLSLLITTDSGPRHFAAAFDRPVVSLFGPTHIEWTETYFAKAVHLQEKVPCGPCQLRVCPVDHRCMIDLKPLKVRLAAEQLLSRKEYRHAC